MLLPISKTLSVGEFTRILQTCLASLPPQWVSGEVSGLKYHQNGHAYFTLKDSEAILPCVLWRKNLAPLPIRPKEGDQVEIYGTLDIFLPHGKYQFSAENLRPKGRGELYAALERSKQRLLAEGLLARDRKRPLPSFPRCIGIVTSPSGAAIYDMLRRILARDAKANVLISPSIVQGKQAAPSIVEALRKLAEIPEVEVVIVGRGGGTLEDLWAFNEESVARAIAAHPVPVVSAVGHETDILLSDLTADVRASTPTHAAELVTPKRQDRERELRDTTQDLYAAIRRQLAETWQTLRLERQALPTPLYLLSQAKQQLEEQQRTLAAVTEQQHTYAEAQLTKLQRRLERAHPAHRLRVQAEALSGLVARLIAARRAILRRTQEQLRAQQAQLSQQEERLGTAIEVSLKRVWESLGRHSDRLQALSPLAVLRRGYAIAEKQGTVLYQTAQLSPGDHILVRLWRGRARCRVEALDE